MIITVDYHNVYVILYENKELLKNVAPPSLVGETITEVWKSVLKNPDKYIVVE
jgi:hypothetical protein